MESNVYLLNRYKNGDFEVSIFSDGTKIRNKVGEGNSVPFPEQLDFKVTNWCDGACSWCHENSTVRGTHAPLDWMVDVFSGLPAGVEVAIGGGDPLSHPDFEEFVHILSKNYGLIPNVTVNQKHLERHYSRLERLIDEGCLYGVGVSLSSDDLPPAWDYEHMVVHAIAGVNHPIKIYNWEKSVKLLILGYKNFGRGTSFFNIFSEDVKRNIDLWRASLFHLSTKHHLCFDTLAISQLEPQRLFFDESEYNQSFMGEEGEFSFYVDGVKKQYALSSYSTERFDFEEGERIVDCFQKIKSLKTVEV